MQGEMARGVRAIARKTLVPTTRRRPSECSSSWTFPRRCFSAARRWISVSFRVLRTTTTTGPRLTHTLCQDLKSPKARSYPRLMTINSCRHGGSKQERLMRLSLSLSLLALAQAHTHTYQPSLLLLGDTLRNEGCGVGANFGEEEEGVSLTRGDQKEEGGKLPSSLSSFLLF